PHGPRARRSLVALRPWGRGRDAWTLLHEPDANMLPCSLIHNPRLPGRRMGVRITTGSQLNLDLCRSENPSVTPRELLALIREKEVRAVDLRFNDFPGLWQHFTIPATELTEAAFEDGLGFDGSSIRGWQAINESDMLVIPVPDTHFLH